MLLAGWNHTFDLSQTFITFHASFLWVASGINDNGCMSCIFRLQENQCRLAITCTSKHLVLVGLATQGLFLTSGHATHMSIVAQYPASGVEIEFKCFSFEGKLRAETMMLQAEQVQRPQILGLAILNKTLCISVEISISPQPQVLGSTPRKSLTSSKTTQLMPAAGATFARLGMMPL